MSADGPVVDEVRQRAMELSARFGHDLRAYGAHLKEVEERYRARVVNQVTVVRVDPTAKTGG
jgi:hypothetical protein